jgi:MoxR-like ATPase
VSWPKTVRDKVKRLNNVKQQLQGTFIDRERAASLLILATLCKEHVLFIGPPGTAKTALINRYTELINTQGFYYLLTRFTEPSELFGPLDLTAFQQGTYTIRTQGMLPDAQIAFLDEIFQGSSAILNSLLTLLNERIFYNGGKREHVPLLTLIGATNIFPDDPSLYAFADRFLLRLELDKVEDDQIDDLLDQGWSLEKDKMEAAIRSVAGQEVSRVLASIEIKDILELHQRLLEVDISVVNSEYSRLMRELRAEGVNFSDRRMVKGLKLIAGAALLREADVASMADFWPLLYLWDRPEEATVVKSVVEPRLQEAGSELLETKRSAEDIVLDLLTLESQMPYVLSDAALGSHLMALNKLRREVIVDHAQNREVLQKIELAIQQGLGQMETNNV